MTMIFFRGKEIYFYAKLKIYKAKQETNLQSVRCFSHAVVLSVRN